MSFTYPPIVRSGGPVPHHLRRGLGEMHDEFAHVLRVTAWVSQHIAPSNGTIPASQPGRPQGQIAEACLICPERQVSTQLNREGHEASVEMVTDLDARAGQTTVSRSGMTPSG
jgi:hypothetical protein